MDQNYVKKPLKSRPGGTKIEVQRAPVQVWKRLGLSWAIKSVFGGVLGRLGSVLERFWRRLGPSWGPTWVQVAPQDAAKMNKKSIPKVINFLMPLEIGLWMDFNRFWDGKWRQVGTKIDQKSMSSAKIDVLKNRALAAAGA